MMSYSGYSSVSNERTDSTQVGSSLYAGAISVMGGAHAEVMRSVRSSDFSRNA